MPARVVSFKVERIDDKAEFELKKVYRRPEDKLADVESPDGRLVSTPDEINFYFSDEPDRPMRVIEPDDI